MRLDKAQRPASAHVTRVIGPLPRLLFALLAAMSLTLSAAVLGQQPARTGTQASVAARTRAAEVDAVRPFRVRVPQKELDDLRRRLAATRWPDRETVADRSQGAQLALLQELVRYWGSGYDWRKAEAKLNTFPQFKTRIDGLDIHFIHVRSRHPNALPLIITHGWPGSVFEQREIAERIIARVAASGRWKRPATTSIEPAATWYSAEEYHQDYLRKHPGGYTCHYLRD